MKRAAIEKSKTTKCIFANPCESRWLCCADCKKKNCEWRCDDDKMACKYKIETDDEDAAVSPRLKGGWVK